MKIFGWVRLKDAREAMAKEVIAAYEKGFRDGERSREGDVWASYERGARWGAGLVGGAGNDTALEATYAVHAQASEGWAWLYLQ